MVQKTPPRFQWRAMTSVLIAAAFLILVLTGTLLFASPPGRVANWTDWRLLGLRKQEWTALHITFSALFLVAAIAHLVFNWRPLLNYFRDRLTRRAALRREWLVGVALCVIVFAGTRYHWPPFASLLAWNETLKNSWEEPGTRAPVPHAELLTLAELSAQAKVDPADAIARLQKAGAAGFTDATLVSEIAASMKVPAQRVYEVISNRPGSANPRGGYGGGPGGGAGGGPGRKTLAQFCTDEGIELTAALQRLAAKGIRARETQTLREIAVENGFSRPYEMMDILRGDSASGSKP